MERIQARDKFIPDALKRGALQAALVFALSVARVGGLYAPWSLAAVAVSGGKGLGLWSLLGAGLGALVLFDFQTGLRFAASALLIYCANLAFCDTKLRARKGYAPLLAAVALLLVQSVYLVGRSAVQWALGAAASAVAAAAACGLDETRQDGRLKLLTILTAVTAALSQIQAAGFSPCGMMAAWLALLCVRAPSLPYTAALGALVGLCADLTGETPVLLWTAVCGCGAFAAALMKKYHRLLQGLVFCLCAAAIPLVLDADRPWLTLYEAAVGALAYGLLPQKWLPDLFSGAAEAMPQAAPAMAAKAAARERAAAFQDLYNTMFRTRPTEKGENPAVIFDHAAQQVCRNCVLVKRC